MFESFFGSREGRKIASESLRFATNLSPRLQSSGFRWSWLVNSEETESPIFVLSAGWRSGSTLLQRMLMKNSDTLIWGEPYDRSEIIQGITNIWRPFTDDWPPENFLIHEHDAQLHESWIANLYPDPSYLLKSQAAYLNTCFQIPANKLGYDRWGVKEVRLDSANALVLKRIFPHAKFIFLYRNPFDAYRSYKPWRRWFRSWPNNPVLTPVQFGKFWAHLTSDFLTNHTAVDGFLVSYESLGENMGALQEYLGIDLPHPSALTRQRGRSGETADLNIYEKAALARTTYTTRKHAGYA